MENIEERPLAMPNRESEYLGYCGGSEMRRTSAIDTSAKFGSE